jgi:hypothetical protein
VIPTTRCSGTKTRGKLAEISRNGLSSDYVVRETKRAHAGLAGAKTKLWPGIDIDIPTAADHSKCSPKGVHTQSSPRFRAGPTA